MNAALALHAGFSCRMGMRFGLRYDPRLHAIAISKGLLAEQVGTYQR